MEQQVPRNDRERSEIGNKTDGKIAVFFFIERRVEEAEKSWDFLPNLQATDPESQMCLKSQNEFASEKLIFEQME